MGSNSVHDFISDIYRQLNAFFNTNLFNSMKHNYVIICLDLMFETVCVAGEFRFFRFWNVFDISDPSIHF